MIFGALYGVFAFAVFFCVQLIFIRSLSSTQWLVWNKRGVLAALVVLSASTELMQGLTGSTWLTSGGWLLSALWGDLTFLCLYVLYMPFYFVVMTSLSVETLIMLHHRGGTLHVSQLQERFSSEAFVADRFATMSRNGMLRQTTDGYAVTEKSRQTIRLFLFIKSLWRLGAGG
jgi:hypothetical protein